MANAVLWRWGMTVGWLGLFSGLPAYSFDDSSFPLYVEKSDIQVAKEPTMLFGLERQQCKNNCPIVDVLVIKKVIRGMFE